MQIIATDPIIQNIVISGKAVLPSDYKIDLVTLASHNNTIEYDPERFPGAVLRSAMPKATILLFSTGKFVITGLHREQDIPISIENLRKDLARNIKNISFTMEYDVVNLVATTNLNCGIDLNMAAVLLEHSMYEPEVFPGMIYRTEGTSVDPHGTKIKWSAVFLVFSTGSIVCTKLRNTQTLHLAVQKLASDLSNANVGVENTIEAEEEEMEFL